MILQFFCLAIFSRANQVPNEAFDIFIPTIVQKTVNEDGTAYRLHISFSHTSLKTSMRQNISPTSPTNKTRRATTQIFWERFKFSNIPLGPRIAISIQSEKQTEAPLKVVFLRDTTWSHPPSEATGSQESGSAEVSHCL